MGKQAYRWPIRLRLPWLDMGHHTGVPTLKPGQVIGGHEILGLHGKGGMGEIFRARQLSIGREVALKVLSPELARKDPQFAIKFVEEARGAGRLNHPNIVAVHDVGKVKVADRDEYLHYFSMEFIDGENLRQILEREGTCPQDLINRTMQGMVEALAYGQLMGMVHRDIKPENIMVTSDGRIKLADFGLAQHGDDVDSEAERDEKGRVRVMGTPRYMSPEQARGRTLDWRSDQYSLGATLFHLLTGSPPYRRESGRATMKAHVADPVPDPGDIIRVSPAWRATCMRMLAKDPNERYQTTDELRDAVNAAVTGKNLPSGNGERPIRARVRQRRDSRRSRAMPLLAAAVIVVIGGGVLYTFFQQEEGVTTGTMADRAEDEPPTRPMQDERRAEHERSAPDERAGEESHSVDQTERRAQEIINQLDDDDHQRGITVLSNNLTNPYYHEESMGYQMLSEELTRRRQLHTEERSLRREAVNQQLRRARRLATHGYFDRAAAVISDIDDADRADNRDLIEQSSNFIRQQAQTLADEYRQSLDEATSLAVLEGLAERIETHGFPSSISDNLSEKHQERTAYLRRHSEQMQAVAASGALRERRWQTLQQRLREARGTPQQPPDIERFITTAEIYEQRFDDQEMRSRCQQLRQLGVIAQSMNAVLRSYIREHNPTIQITSTGNRYRARIDSIEDHRMWVTILDSGVRIRKELTDSDVDHLALVQQAHQANGHDADQLNAYCWIWQLDPQRGFNDEELIAASSYLNDENAQSDENAASEASQGDKSPTPPFIGQGLRFTAEHSELLQWFSGEGASITDDGLQWHCQESVRLGNLSEPTIPSLRLNHSLSGPLHIRLQVQVHGGGLALIGLKQEQQAVRLGFDTRNMRVGGIVSDAQGAVQSNPLPTPNNALTRPMRLDITMNAEGHISFAINGTGYEAPQNLFSLDGDSPVTLVFQALNTNNSTRVSVTDIAITSP